MGFMFADVPCVNNLMSIFLDMQRPLVYSEVRKVAEAIKTRAKREGQDTSNLLSVVPMQYFGNQGDVLGYQEIQQVPLDFPCVVKVGSCHAGYGKALAQKAGDLNDIASIVALNQLFFTAETYLDFDFEYRIQKIGDHVRCFKRGSSNCWKSNWGDLRFEDIPVSDVHREFALECGKIWGGIDVCAIDVVHLKDGREFVLELNNSANGFYFDHEQEDAKRIAQLVVAKMNTLWPKTN
eukprot:TRINITY_DN231_c0_g1_i2.p1 TRINITY_DN231_c0_g1~~TRINITY_DN231_c0_g1_i2.p1  ORF type:complete len:237 (+),score=66.47 TRINITY_DN231_c0_g1_i2:385-1095(+)